MFYLASKLRHVLFFIIDLNPIKDFDHRKISFNFNQNPNIHLGIHLSGHSFKYHFSKDKDIGGCDETCHFFGTWDQSDFRIHIPVDDYILVSLSHHRSNGEKLVPLYRYLLSN